MSVQEAFGSAMVLMLAFQVGVEVTNAARRRISPWFRDPDPRQVVLPAMVDLRSHRYGTMKKYLGKITCLECRKVIGVGNFIAWHTWNCKMINRRIKREERADRSGQHRSA
jgi:hypothetical protein